MNYNRCHAADDRARKLFKKYHGIWPEQAQESKMRYNPSVEGLLGIYRKTKVFCSNSFCCGNPRRGKEVKLRLTRQEIRAPKINEEW